MPRKRKVFSSPKKKPIRNPTPLTLNDKLKILDLVHSGKSCTEIGRMYGKNECSIRRIKNTENYIRALARRVNVETTPEAPPSMAETLTLGDKLRIIDLVRNQNKEMSEVAEIYGISCDDVRYIFVNEKPIQERAASATAKNPKVPKIVHANPSKRKRNPQTLKIESKVEGKGGKRMRLSISEKLQVLNMIEHEKKTITEVSKIIGRSDGCIRHIMENAKRLRECGPMLLARQNDQFAVLKDEIIIKTEEALYLWVMDMINRRQLITNKMIGEKAIELHRNLAKKSGKKKKRFLASHNWVVKFKQTFNIKTGEGNAYDVLSKCNGDTLGLRLENGVSHPKKPFKSVKAEDDEESLNQSTQFDTSDMDVEKTELRTMSPALGKESKEWTLETLNDVLKTAEELMGKIIKHDPSTDRSTNLTQGIIQVLEPLYEICDNLESEVNAKSLCGAKQESDDFQLSSSALSNMDDTPMYYNIEDILN